MLKESARNTQREVILELLLSARGGWVPLPKIAACAAQYGARVFELRRLGYYIANRTQDVNGVRHSWFRLESGPGMLANPKSQAPESLFEITERHRDDG
jgi:hypothetical protein